MPVNTWKRHSLSICLHACLHICVSACECRCVCRCLCVYVCVLSSSELPQGYIPSFWWLQTCRRAEQSPSWDTLNYGAHARTYTHMHAHIQTTHAHTPLQSISWCMSGIRSGLCVSVCLCVRVGVGGRKLFYELSMDASSQYRLLKWIDQWYDYCLLNCSKVWQLFASG